MDRRLDLLGGFAMSLGGAPAAPAARKARALLALLAAARRRSLPRARLAALLWERADAEGARASLRQAVAQVRRAGGEGWILSEADALTLAPSVATDLAEFAEALARGDDAAAARLYAGPFVEDLAPGGADLEAALAAERARLADLAAGALRRELDRLGPRAEGAQAAHRLLSLDPLDEAAHRRLMEWDAGRGARGAARARFETLREALRRDLSVAPEPETVALMDRIRRGDPGLRPAEPPAPDPAPASTAASMPAEATEPPLLLLALAAEGEADWPRLRAALGEAGGAALDCGPGEAAALFPGADLRAVASGAHALAQAAGETLSFALGEAPPAAPGEAAGGPGAAPLRALARLRRLAAQAAPGTVLLEPALAARLGLAAAGAGATPLDAAPAPARPRLPLVGREVELAQVASACAAARAAGAGLVVHLSGEAGIGKSRLAAEIARRPTGRGGSVIEVGFSPLGGGGRHIGQDLAAALGAIPPGAARDPYDRALAEWLVAPCLTREAELRLSALGDADRRRRAQQVLARALAERAEAEGGLCVVIEDCHWAPAGAGDFLLDLADRLAEAPLTLVLTERPHDASLDHRLAARGRPGLVRLALAPLSPGAAERLARLADAGAADLPHALQRAAGHPLFLLRLLEANWTSGELPATVTGLVLEQIERLPPETRAALRRAALLGTRFDPADLAAIFPGTAALRPQGDLLHAVSGGLAFGHDLIRQAIYDDLDPQTRADWHARAAAHFRGADPVSWAEHARLAPDDAEACRAATAAANAMIAEMRLTRARRFIEEGLARPGDPEAVAELHSCRAGIRRMRGDLRGALDDYRAAHRAAVSDVTRVAMLVRQALVLHRLDRGAEADRALDLAEALADAIGLAGLGRAEIHEQRGNRAFVEGDAEACLRQHAAGLAAAERAGDPRGVARAHGGLGDAHFSAGRLRTAHRHFDRAVTMAAEAGLGMVHQEFAFMRSYTLFFAEPGARAHLLADLAVEAAAGAGADRAEMIARETRAEMRLAALDLDGAQEDIARLGELVAREPETRFSADLAALTAWRELRAGDAPAAFARLEPLFGPAQANYYNGAILLALGALAAPDRAARRTLLDRGDARLAAGALSCAAIWYHCFALEAAARDDDLARGRLHLARLRQATQAEPLGLADLALEAAARRFEGPASPAELEALRGRLAEARLSGLAGLLAGAPVAAV